MTEREIRDSLLEANKGRAFVSARIVRDWLGVGHNTSVELLQGLESVEGKFFIPDVARQIVKKAAVKWRET